MIINNMQGLDSVSKIKKKIISKLKKKKKLRIFPNWPGFGPVPKAVRKNTGLWSVLPKDTTMKLLVDPVKVEPGVARSGIL